VRRKSPGDEPGHPDALLARLPAPSNEITQGWMRWACAGRRAAEGNRVFSEYFDKQARLWRRCSRQARTVA
jgi:hypothetical protein